MAAVAAVVRGYRSMPGVPTPKDRFTSLDTLALVRELRALRRARVDKVFDLPATGWALSLRVPREGRWELVLVPGRFAAVLSEPVRHTEELSPFARQLRRWLEGATLEEVPDPGGERLLEVVLRRSDEPEPIRLALEMFGTGNLVVARGELIAAVAQTRRWAHRTVAVGAQYARPPSRADPFTLGLAEIEAELARSRTDLASTLGARLALGGPLGEELIARGGWDGTVAAATDAHRVGPELHRILQALWLEVGDRPKGYLYRRDGVAVDATPYRSQRWQELRDVEEVERHTFSLAAFDYFPTLLTLPSTPEEQARSQLLKELEHQVERQRVAVADLERRAEALKADAAAVFDHYPEAERLRQEAADRDPEASAVEVRLGDRTVSLLIEESPRVTAQHLFEEAKRVQSKLSGAVSALAEAEEKLTGLRHAPAPAPATTSPLAVVASRRRERWFERYRWFLSSEGAVVVAGRDATTNDQVVKRHLKEGDLYVHADLHGAASVVVKHAEPGTPPFSEKTIREAGQWAVTFSKAWRAGLAAASAFWVAPDQVSKAGTSGEFVARGAWVIHGTKHFLHDLPLEVGIGTVDYEGESLWTVAPPSAFVGRGRLRAVLTPGPEAERPREEVALARELGLSRSRLQALLPAGGLSVRRV